MPQNTGHGCQLHFNTSGTGGKGGRHLFLDSVPKIVYPYPEIFSLWRFPHEKAVPRPFPLPDTALCVSGSTAALAEAPAATPAPQDQRVITDVSPLEDQIRNIVGFTTSTGGPYDFEQADHKSAVQAYGAEPAEGAVALLRVYARAEDRGDASINSSGHSFLSVRNVSDHDIEVGGLRIAPNTEMTFSPRGNRWEHTGIWYNLEGYYKRYLADSYYQNIYAVQTSLDQGQLDVVNRNLAKSDHWSAYFNCAAFTESMWNAVCADTLSAGQPYTPENLRNDILAKYGDLAAYNPQVPYDYIVYYGTSLTPSKEFA